MGTNEVNAPACCVAWAQVLSLPVDSTLSQDLPILQLVQARKKQHSLNWKHLPNFSLLMERST